MSEIKVIGHINPDTDSTCTPSVYAWYLREKKGLDAKVYVSSEPNREALYVLERFQFDVPEILTEIKEDDKVIIIDANNADELIEGIEKADILQIIDHHKIFGNIKTSRPVHVTMRPVACVATIIWSIMKTSGVTDIPENIAGMLLGSIISDTLNYSSPTTTQEDLDAGNELASIAKVDVNELADKMFEAKSDLAGMDADAILHMDSKMFDMEGKQVRISTLETTNTGIALGMSDVIKKRMEELKQEENLDMIFFFVVDIIKSSSYVLVTTDAEKRVIEKAFDTKFSNDTINLPGIVSRKKQMVPAIEKALK